MNACCTSYQQYVQTMQSLETTQGRSTSQAPYAEGFESIYQKAQEEDVQMSNAAEFLQGLTQEEMDILQHYSGLADAIDANSISNEGAYNLLLHDYEQYDFNENGSVEVGKGNRSISPVARMDTEMGKAYVEAYNSLSDKEKLLSHIFTLDTARLASMINGTPYKPQPITYASLKARIDGILNPTPPSSSSDEIKAVAEKFWEAFETAYTADKQASGEEAEETENSENQKYKKMLADLREKGAARFLADLNQEKIDEKVEEYKEKLIKSMGGNPSPEDMKVINDLVEEYRKELMEKLQEKNQLTSKESTSNASESPLTQWLQEITANQ